MGVKRMEGVFFPACAPAVYWGELAGPDQHEDQHVDLANKSPEQPTPQVDANRAEDF